MLERLCALILAAVSACGGSQATPPRAVESPAAALRPLSDTGATPVDSAVLTIRVLAVTSRSGGGDAILIADSAAEPARHVLIDAGDDGAAAAALRALGVASLDLLVLTHAHHDHYGGVDEVLDAVPVRVFAFNGQVRNATTYVRMLERIEREVPTVLVVDSVRHVRLGTQPDATLLTLLPPLAEHLAADTDSGSRLNEGSLAVRVERGSFSFLTTGDAEEAANRRFAARFPGAVDVDVLKLGHHGSADATQPAWLDATTPAAAIVSANGTTHPFPEVIELVQGTRGIALYCTPQHGTVTVRVDAGGRWRVLTEHDAGRRCEPGSQR